MWTDIIAHLTSVQRNTVSRLVDLSSPPDFFEYTRSLFPSPGTVTTEGRTLILNLVLAWGVLLAEGFSSGSALELAVQAQRVVAFDAQLMQILGQYTENVEQKHQDMIVRGLDLIDKLGPKPRILMPLAKFLRHPNPKVRSKVAKIIGQISLNQGWIDRFSTEADARIRSNLLEAVVQNADFDQDQLRNLLHRATRDPHSRVSVTALYLLARMGDQPSLERLHALQQNADPAMRKSADWAVAQLKR